MRISRPFTTPPTEQAQPGADSAAAPAPAAAGAAPDYVQDLVFIVARDGRILYVNQPLGDMVADAAIGQSIFDWMAEEQHAGLRDALEGVFTAGALRGLELCRLPRHEPQAWYEGRLSPTHRGGEVVSATLIARDITRHKLAIEELNRRYAELERRHRDREADLAQVQAQLSEALATRDAEAPVLHRFRALLDAAGEAIFITDPASGTVFDANGTACRWLRRAREEVLGRTAAELGLEFAIELPEEQDLSFTETRDSRRPTIITGGVHRRQDGSSFPVEVAVARHRWGEDAYVLAVVRDVKQREHGLALLKQREAAYHDLFEQSWDGIYLTTRSGQITDVNPALADLLGYARDEMAGLDARVLFPRTADIRRFQETLAADGIVRDLEIELRRKDGNVLPALLSATRRQGSDGSIQGHQCVVRARAGSETAPLPSAPAAAAAFPAMDPVLVVDTAAASRAEMMDLLQRASIPALEAGGLARAIQLLREHAGAVGAVLIAVEPGERGVDLTVEEFRRIDREVPIIINSSEDRLVLAGQLADLNIAAFLDRAVHPLALLQRVRELATRHPA
jgi:PAS domain S-box-containing protein